MLGYAGTDNRGLAGLELGLEKVLAGKAGSETMIRDPTGRPIDILSSTAAQEGQNVTLTLDHTIQAQAEAVLRKTIDRLHANSASAIVLDPRTGGILAMAVERGYDANRFPIVPKDRQRNRTVTDTYEPGSTFKLVTVSAALSEGLVTPHTAFTLPYSIHVSDRVIHDAHPRGTERMTVDQILSHSSNVGTITLAQLLGPQKLSRVDQPLRVRPQDRDRLPGRDARDRPAARALVGLDDRDAADRARDRDHAGADGRRLRDGRQRRRLAPAAPRRAGRHARAGRLSSRAGSSRRASRARCCG